jgi:hypothetical protein
MRERLSAAGAKVQRLWRLLVLFLVLRLVVGVIFIAWSGAVAWSMELTLIVAAAVLVYVLVALAVRRWAPPRRAS